MRILFIQAIESWNRLIRNLAYLRDYKENFNMNYIVNSWNRLIVNLSYLDYYLKKKKKIKRLIVKSKFHEVF